MEDRNKSRYSVTLMNDAKEAVRSYAKRAAQIGIYENVTAALKQIEQKLQFKPIEWGDILGNYDYIQANEYRGMVPKMFLVWYGVDIASKVVIVRRIGPAPGSPFDK